MSLEPIQPSVAVEKYIEAREPELSKQTIYAHQSRLGHLVRWCDEVGIDNLNELSGRDLHDFKVWRRNDGDINKVSLKTQINTLRVFIRWCETIDAVEQDLSEKILSPSLAKHEDERDEKLDAEVADAILDYLEIYEYASFDHVVFLLIQRCLLRRGGIRALDLGDVNLEDLYIQLRHRPESDTPLKNKEDGERFIAISEPVRNVLGAYIDVHRNDVEDEFGRKPLLTTQGRPALGTIQATVYAFTRPCLIQDDCPHDRDIEECDAARDRQEAYSCPSSLSPHAMRRGAITNWLSADVPPAAVGARASTSVDVLDRHYDRRSEKSKMEQRRKYLDML